MGSTWVQAAGGGCTVPGATRADGSWSRTLNQVQARFFNNVLEGSRRLRVRVMHPMDTGLVAGMPAFYIEQLQLVDGAGAALVAPGAARAGVGEPAHHLRAAAANAAAASGCWVATTTATAIDAEVSA